MMQPVSVMAQDAAIARWERVVPEVDGRRYPQYQARIGSVQVPENRRDVGRSIDVFFIHIESPNANPQPPLFVLGAGPGGSGIREAQNVLEELPGIIEQRDIVGMDQRGTGRSGPNLTRSFTTSYPGPSDRRGLLAAYEGLIADARGYWASQGVDLRGYNTWEAAADIETIRASLGYDQIALFGFSYGSHLGLTILRRIPHRIQRAAFLAIEGPDQTFKTPAQMQQGLELVHRLVQADTMLSVAIPDLLSLVVDVIERVQAQPVTVEIDGPDGHRVAVTITEWDVRKFAASLLGRRRSVASLPALFARMRQGDFAEVAQEVLRWRRTLHVSALHGVTDCASGASTSRRALIEEQRHMYILGDLADFPYPHVCDAWNVPELDDSYRAPVVADVPVLLVSGSLDSRTPPSNAVEVSMVLANSYLVVVENEGHDVYPSQEIGAFLRTGRPPRQRTLRAAPIRFDAIPSRVIGQPNKSMQPAERIRF